MVAVAMVKLILSMLVFPLHSSLQASLPRDTRILINFIIADRQRRGERQPNGAPDYDQCVQNCLRGEGEFGISVSKEMMTMAKL